MKNNETQETTWKPYSLSKHGKLSTSEKNALPTSAFAFPYARKEPMIDVSHVRNAM